MKLCAPLAASLAALLVSGLGLPVGLAQAPKPAPAAPAAPAAPPAPAVAPAPVAPAAPVRDLAARITELERLAAELGTLEQASGDLARRLTALEEDLDTARRSTQAGMADRSRLDGLEVRLSDVARRIASVESELAPTLVPASPLETTYEDGFVMRTADRRFSSRLRLVMQPRFQGRTSADADDISEAGLSMRRSRLVLDGTAFGRELAYRLQLEFLVDPILFDFFFDRRLGHGVTARVGLFKAPFSRSWLASGPQLLFPERAVSVNEFRGDRDFAVALLGRHADRVLWQAFVGNGSGRARSNDNIDFLGVLRVDVAVLGAAWDAVEGDQRISPRPGIMLGAAVSFQNAPVPGAYGFAGLGPAVEITNTDVDNDGERDNVREIEVELSASFRWRGFGLEAEGAWRREDWGGIPAGQGLVFVPDEDLLGGMVQASYFFTPQLYAGARGSLTEVSPLINDGKSRPARSCTFTGGAPGECALPEADIRREVSAVVGGLATDGGLRLTAMYSYLAWEAQHVPDPEGLDEHRLILETTLAF